MSVLRQFPGEIWEMIMVHLTWTERMVLRRGASMGCYAAVKSIDRALRIWSMCTPGVWAAQMLSDRTIFNHGVLLDGASKRDTETLLRLCLLSGEIQEHMRDVPVPSTPIYVYEDILYVNGWYLRNDHRALTYGEVCDALHGYWNTQCLAPGRMTWPGPYSLSIELIYMPPPGSGTLAYTPVSNAPWLQLEWK